MAIQSINPTTGEVLHHYREIGNEEINTALLKAARAFESWRKIPFSKRAALMKSAAAVLQQHAEPYARLMAVEMGKPVSQGRKEIEKCALICDYYAENAEKFLLPEIIPTEASKSYVIFEPLGVVLAVMPWNFPFWQVFRAAVPALMAGNVVILKHASNVPGCAETIESVFKQASFPEGIFTNFFLETPHVSLVIEHPAVKAVTLTGSVQAGQAVAAKAGSLIKKTVLELGGSDAYIILEDANLEKAIQICGESRLVNGGQSCISAKRFLVVEKVYEKFVSGLVNFMKNQKIGNPLEEEVTVGPLARHDLRDAIHHQVVVSVKMGAELLLGGNIPDGPGAFYPPTILGHIKKRMPVFDEEVFGPVAAVVKVHDKKEAIQMANDSVFGLGAAVFTSDVARGERIAREELNAGSAFVNALVRSDPRLPFGGIKQSGYGRELGVFGIREFVNVKTVYIQ
ncbi:MAG: NAD-dependent succinate-semialdehyde dehydrogenase [Candidatus Omnitrophica bacterium]|nr:NAD-dependent succinate-semialdehyde dehydrogenase [Candidatus Omnitrophota bacterium]